MILIYSYIFSCKITSTLEGSCPVLMTERLRGLYLILLEPESVFYRRFRMLWTAYWTIVYVSSPTWTICKVDFRVNFPAIHRTIDGVSIFSSRWSWFYCAKTFCVTDRHNSVFLLRNWGESLIQYTISGQLILENRTPVVWSGLTCLIPIQLTPQRKVDLCTEGAVRIDHGHYG